MFKKLKYKIHKIEKKIKKLKKKIVGGNENDVLFLCFKYIDDVDIFKIDTYDLLNKITNKLSKHTNIEKKFNKLFHMFIKISCILKSETDVATCFLKGVEDETFKNRIIAFSNKQKINTNKLLKIFKLCKNMMFSFLLSLNNENFYIY
jgi:hypothetical protein